MSSISGTERPAKLSVFADDFLILPAHPPLPPSAQVGMAYLAGFKTSVANKTDIITNLNDWLVLCTTNNPTGPTRVFANGIDIATANMTSLSVPIILGVNHLYTVATGGFVVRDLRV